MVTLCGRDHYLGPHGSKSSRQAYDRLIAEWLANQRQLPFAITGNQDLTLVELMEAYLLHVESYYVKNGKPTAEQANTRQAMVFLERDYGSLPVSEFGPLRLKAVRERMIDANHSRNYINHNIGRIKLMFRWGVENELVPPDVCHGLMAVSGLRRGRSRAKESTPVTPVHVEAVKAVRATAEEREESVQFRAPSRRRRTAPALKGAGTAIFLREF